MKKKIFFATLVLIGTFLVSGVARAMTFDPADYVFIFHLYLNNKGQLTLNRDYQLNYETGPGPYQPEVVADPTKAYHADLLDAQGSVISQVKFDPKQGQANYFGPVDVTTPDYPTAKTVKFYDNTSKSILSIDTTNTLSCVVDGKCDSQIEDQYSCPQDCGPAPSDVTTSVPVFVSLSPSPIATTSSSNTWLWLIIVLVAVAIAGLTTWFIIRNRLKKVPIS